MGLGDAGEGAQGIPRSPTQVLKGQIGGQAAGKKELDQWMGITAP